MADTRSALEAELAALREESARRNKLIAQREDLQSQRVERVRRERETADMLRKEQGDVDALEGYSPKALLLRITGDREVRLSRERQEAVAAALQHDQALRDLEDLDGRLEKLELELAPLRDCGDRQRELLARKRALLREEGGQRGERIGELEEALAASALQRKELREAMDAGQAVCAALEEAGGSLDSAAGWGTWDLLGGGLLTDLAKHGHIDDARNSIDAAQRLLSRFRTELADVSRVEAPGVCIGEFATFADWFFDGLIADWFVQDGIRQAQSSVANTRGQVMHILRKLEHADQEEQAACRRMEAELDTLAQA